MKQTSEDTALNSYVKRISAAWTRSVDSILETATLCKEANEALSTEDKKKLLDSLPFKAPTFSKLVKIGSDKRLYKNREFMPPCFSTMYETSLLDDGRFNLALESGKIHPDMKRDEAIALKSARIPSATLPFETGEDAAPALKKPTALRFAEIRVSQNFPKDSYAQLEQELETVTKAAGAELVRLLTPEEKLEQTHAAAMRAFSSRWERYGRQLARARVIELRQATKAAKKKWRFAPDETEIDDIAGWDQIQRVLENVGIQDELEDIRAQAEVMANAPDAIGPDDPPEVFAEVLRGLAGDRSGNSTAGANRTA